MNFLWVFLGGGLGSCLRYGIAEFSRDWFAAGGRVSFGPIFATSLANLLACALLGYGLALASQGKLEPTQRLLLLTGFCGGFSTFSTFSAELVQLQSAGRMDLALLYLLISVGGGVGVIWWLS